MAIYTVYLPKTGEPERAVFLRDGFSFWALAYGPLWLLWRGAWWTGLGVIITVLGLFAVLGAIGFGPGYALALHALIHLFIGIEGSQLLALNLRLRKFSLAGVVESGSEIAAEARYFSSLEKPVPQHDATAPIAPAAAYPAHPSGIIGSFPSPSSGMRGGQ